jgi:hypothetical protein
MKQDIDKLIKEEVIELLKQEEICKNIYNYSYISDIIISRLKNKGYTEIQAKEIKISIYGRLQREIMKEIRYEKYYRGKNE